MCPALSLEVATSEGVSWETASLRPPRLPAAGRRHKALVGTGQPGMNTPGGAVKAADNTRFANVVLPYLDDAYALARWVMGNRADAEDVVQEACLRALRGISGYSGGNGRAWTLAIVRNAAYDWLRKNRPAAIVPVEDIESAERLSSRDHAAVAPPVDPETALIAKADELRLQAAIEGLPTTFRETLVLRDVQGLGYREIAEITGVPIGTVMSRLARARERLIETLGAENHFGSGEK
jgi:RNA polymerase sigma factor (sigma-70 family)